jgi:hypothetical protein
MFRTRASTPRLISRPTSSIRPWIQVRHVARRERGRPVGVANHWTPEKLAVDDRFPLTAELNQHMHPTMVERKIRGQHGNVTTLTKSAKSFSSVHVRSQIVSPDLCGMLYL